MDGCGGSVVLGALPGATSYPLDFHTWVLLKTTPSEPTVWDVETQTWPLTAVAVPSHPQGVHTKWFEAICMCPIHLTAPGPCGCSEHTSKGLAAKGWQSLAILTCCGHWLSARDPYRVF